MPKYLAIIEVDQRQGFIFGADKLLEILGGSRIISNTVSIAAEESDKSAGKVNLIWPVSGVVWFSSSDLESLSDCVWRVRERVQSLGLSVSIQLEEYAEERMTEAIGRAERNNRINKDAKYGEDGRPHCPYFAMCNIQPNLRPTAR